MLATVPLNVLHISESDVGGGAARTAHTIHTGLGARGHTSRMLVGRRLSEDPGVRSVKRNDLWRAADRAAGTVLDRLSLQYVFYPSSFGVARDPWFRDASIVQLHNLHGSYFSFTALPFLTRRRPTLWLLQDQWSMTGHVAYSLDCERWRHGCGTCPYLHEYPRLRRDTTRALFRIKDGVYKRSRLELVVPSQWMVDAVGASPLLSRFPVHRIPHGIDTDVFRPRSRAEARQSLELPLDRPIVFFSASDLHEPRKGLRFLVDALRGMSAPPLLLLAGAGDVPTDVETRSLGPVHDDEVLARAYAASDIYAVPTVADVLTQTAPESIASGTPCVSFDRGGVIDVVRDGETGLHARFADSASLADAIARLLGDDELRERLGRNGRALAEQEFSSRVQVDRYVRLYEEVLRSA
jgi:glycosyltransferase involved in cell wall biosynthesis